MRKTSSTFPERGKNIWYQKGNRKKIVDTRRTSENDWVGLSTKPLSYFAVRKMKDWSFVGQVTHSQGFIHIYPRIARPLLVRRNDRWITIHFLLQLRAGRLAFSLSKPHRVCVFIHVRIDIIYTWIYLWTCVNVFLGYNPLIFTTSECVTRVQYLSTSVTQNSSYFTPTQASRVFVRRKSQFFR